MEFRQQRYFVGLAEELHFGRAAAKLGISQPALSKQIRGLEAEVGTSLFWRSKREVRLTAAGTAFLGHAREVLSRVDRSISEARSVGRGELGSLEIGYMSSTSALIVPRAVRAFRKQHPGVEVKLRLLIPPAHRFQISSSQVDFAFIVESGEREKFVVEVILREHLMIALPKGHPLAAHSQLGVRDLKGVPLVMYPRYGAPEMYDQTMRYLRSAGTDPNIVVEVMPAYGILSSVAAGIGVALVPECLLGIRQEGVVYRKMKAPRLPITWAIAYRPGKLDGAREAFLKVVRRLFPV